MWGSLVSFPEWSGRNCSSGPSRTALHSRWLCVAVSSRRCGRVRCDNCEAAFGESKYGDAVAQALDKIAAIVDATLQTKPAGMTHWSCRTLAQSQGVSKSTVNNIWRAHNLQPHRTETFKLSRDPKFLEKMTDVVGLYLNPPQQAIILCVDEKSQIQALDRTQPGLPIKKGRCGTMTHDYKRNGTTTLFAALETLRGQGGRRMP